RPLIYAHLGLVYSLLIATTLSVCFGLLTKNDEIFVLVIVASPASVALWCMTLARRFPLPLTENPPPSPAPNSTDSEERAISMARNREIRWDWEPMLLQGAAAGSLVFELVMVFVTMAPRSWRVFRQPACAQAGPGGRPANALWAYCYLEGAAWVGMGYVLWEFVCRGDRAETAKRPEKVAKRSGSDESRTTLKLESDAQDEWEQWRIAAEPDIITWTEIFLEEHLPTASAPKTKAAIIFLLQCIALPDVGLVSYQNVAVLAILVVGVVSDLLEARKINWRGLLCVLITLALGAIPNT
ncbi:hypothetical protein H0H87_004263, partial [Tephrocybe sp. NHM501043]